MDWQLAIGTHLDKIGHELIARFDGEEDGQDAEGDDANGDQDGANPASLHSL